MMLSICQSSRSVIVSGGDVQHDGGQVEEGSLRYRHLLFRTAAAFPAAAGVRSYSLDDHFANESIVDEQYLQVA